MASDSSVLAVVSSSGARESKLLPSITSRIQTSPCEGKGTFSNDKRQAGWLCFSPAAARVRTGLPFPPWGGAVNQVFAFGADAPLLVRSIFAAATDGRPSVTFTYLTMMNAIQVNCAAWTARATLDTTTVDVWDRMMNTNVRGPFLLVQVGCWCLLTGDTHAWQTRE